MSYREILSSRGTPGWTISLATHLGTELENETTPPVLELPPQRVKREQQFRDSWPTKKEPTAGYNCFGHVFASRRTGLYKVDVDTILYEDGFGRIPNAGDADVGDAVIYSDEDGPTHAGVLIRFDEVELGLQPGDAPTRIPLVLSKFDDVSGEYEHKLADHSWSHPDSPIVSTEVYRPRHQPPRKKPGWRGVVSALDESGGGNQE